MGSLRYRWLVHTEVLFRGYVRMMLMTTAIFVLFFRTRHCEDHLPPADRIPMVSRLTHFVLLEDFLPLYTSSK